MTQEDEAPQGSLAAAIIDLRKRVGSQGKLAAKVRVSERTVKRWEHGAIPQQPARERLIRLGVDAQLFAHAQQRETIERRLRAVEGEVARIREELQA